MNSHEVFIHIHQGCFAGTGAIVRLPQCRWSKPDGYGKISQCITTTKHSKAKTVCIFLGIYCRFITHWTLTGDWEGSFLSRYGKYFRYLSATAYKCFLILMCEILTFLSVRSETWKTTFMYNVEPISQRMYALMLSIAPMRFITPGHCWCAPTVLRLHGALVPIRHQAICNQFAYLTVTRV